MDYFDDRPSVGPNSKEEIKDNVNHPSHYTQGKVECIDAIEAATVHKNGLDAVCTANIIKYIWRCENKNGIEDLKKARWYL
ncbi:MAG: Klebsiella phage vB KpnM KpV52, partial [Bacteroidota bacterium]